MSWNEVTDGTVDTWEIISDKSAIVGIAIVGIAVVGFGNVFAAVTDDSEESWIEVI